MAGHIRTGINFKSNKVMQVTFFDVYSYWPTTMETICTVALCFYTVNLKNYIFNSLWILFIYS